MDSWDAVSILPAIDPSDTSLLLTPIESVKWLVTCVCYWSNYKDRNSYSTTVIKYPTAWVSTCVHTFCGVTIKELQPLFSADSSISICIKFFADVVENMCQVAECYLWDVVMKTNFLGVVQSNESISTLVVVVKCLRQFSNLCSFKYCVEKSICTVRDEFCISELKFKGLYCQQCSFIDGVCTCIEGECLSFLEVNGLHVMLRKSVRSHCSSLYTHIGLTHCSVGCYFT